MAHSHPPPPHWQPVRVAAAEEPKVLSPTERKGSFSFTELKRLGTSFSWKSWTKSFRSKTESDDASLATLTACSHGWIPYTMRKRVLVPMAIWTAALAAVIEVLAQQSIRDGGLSLSPTPDNISDTAKFVYLFLPTIIAVIFSITWSWVDLDFKRIQPWLELSREDGAVVRDSLILDYPYDFVALAPFKAAKRRHWTVFISGTVMILVFWIITPLQGAIFGTGPVRLTQPASFYASSELMPIQDQSRATDTSILQRLYAIKYLDQTYPPFTTAEYALRPFELEAEAAPGTKNWTATTTKFWTDIECWPAEWELAQSGGYFDFHNGQGCNASGIATVPGASYRARMQYLAWHNSAWASQFLQRTASCAEQFSHQFLATAAKGTSEDPEITALFCETRYWKQDVRVSVPSDTFHPHSASVTSTGPVEKLHDTEFNATGFEYLMGASVSEIQNVARDYPHNIILDQYDKVNGTSLAYPLSPLVGYAVGGREREIDDYFDEEVLADAYRGVHKALFALAYNSLLTNATASNATVEGTVDIALHGVIVSRLFSALVEGFLFTVAACSLLLAFLSTRRKSNLTNDPASLGDLIDILQSSPELVNAVYDTDAPRGDSPEDEGNPRLRLRCNCDGAYGSMTIGVTGLQQPLSISAKPKKDSEESGAKKSNMSKPLVLRKKIGSVFILFLIAAFIGLLYLKAQEKKLGGLIRPTDDFDVLQILENYIPTAIATMIEPYWVLLNRLISIVQPFHDLRKGGGKNQHGRVVRAAHASLPPPLSIWSALRSRHFVLAVVCLVTMLSNVLAVGLGGLFNEKSTQVSYPVDLQYLQSEEFAFEELHLSTQSGRQHINFFGVQGNLSLGIPMSPWVSAEYYFRPFGPQGTTQMGDLTEALKGRTRGYGVQVTCDKLPAPTKEEDPVDLRPFKLRHGITNPACPDFHNQSLSSSQTGPVAVEGATAFCFDALLLFWGRANQSSPDPDFRLNRYACYPHFRTALFDVAVDAKGRVLSHERASDFADTLPYEKAQYHARELMGLSMRAIGTGPGSWHNDTASQGWLWDTIKTMGNERFLDPLEPIPDPSEVLPLVYDIWHRSFAFLLSSNETVAYVPLADADQPPAFQGAMVVSETRIFISEAAFIISATILALNIVVAAVVYATSTSWFLPRMPTMLAAILEFMAPSRALRQYSPASTSRLGFGGYIGLDGKKHVGIEFAQLVLPPQGSSSTGEESGGRLRGGWLRRRRDQPLEGGRDSVA